MCTLKRLTGWNAVSENISASELIQLICCLDQEQSGTTWFENDRRSDQTMVS